MGWLISASRRSVDGVSAATVSALWSTISSASRVGVEMQAYTNGLIDGLAIGFSDGIGGVWRFGVCVTPPLAAIWTLYKA